MNISYENKYGTIKLSGGGTNNTWKICEIKGLGFLNKNFTYNTYAGIVGQELNAVSIGSRIITISGDISYECFKVLSSARAHRILNEDGRLKIINNGKIRCANVRTLSFELEDKRSSYRKFVLQVESDNPYFYGANLQKRDIYKRENKLTSPFILPCVFSTRTNGSTIINTGDVDTEPIITIYKSEVFEGLEDNLILTNETEHTSIKLNHTMQAGETIIVNIPKRSVISSLSGNILTKLSNDTVLSSFKFIPGANNVICENDDNSLVITCEFNELFLEASYE